MASKSFSNVKIKVTHLDLSKDTSRSTLVSGENISHSLGKIARWYKDISWSGHKHTKADITDFAHTHTSLDTSIDVGSEYQPVYFLKGVPTALQYTIKTSVPANAVFTDTNTKVTSVGNHYTPSGGTTTSASGGTLTDITNSANGVQVVTGVTKDAAGHVTGVTSIALKSVNSNTVYAGGTGITIDANNAINHSNSITAITTAAFKKFKYDAQGHITGTANVTASDIPSHSHTVANITDFPVVITGGSQTSSSSSDGGSNIYTFTKSDGTSSTLTVKNGSKGSQGIQGVRGNGIYPITTAPASFTTTTGGFTPVYRATLSTVLSESKATEIKAGDQLRYSYYLYPVGYVDSTYVYLGTRTSIRGATGASGAAATITVGTVTTGAAGSSASVTNSGTTAAAILDFVIPKGADGKNGTNGTNGTSATWFTGTVVTGTNTTATTFTVSGSKAGDMYLNTSTSNVYRASAANSWIYVCNIKGTAGTTPTLPTFSAEAGTNIGSVGTPSVSYNNGKFTFNYLKGAKGDKGDPGTNATTTAVVSTSANGLAPKVTDTNKFLKGDGTWATPYTHPSYTSKTSGLYKITVDATGHISAATAVAKADITGLGIPGSDTNTTYSFQEGTTNGSFQVKASSASSWSNVSIHGLGSAAYTSSTDYAAASHTHDYLPLTGGTLSGVLKLQTGTTTSTVTYDDAVNPRLTFSNSNDSQYLSLVYTDYDAYQKPDSLTLIGNQSGSYFIAPNIKATSKFYGDLSGTATAANRLKTYSIDPENSDASSKPWFRIAYATTNVRYIDIEITLLVSHHYISGGQGILKVRARTEATAGVFGDSVSIVWTVMSGFSGSDFKLVIKNNYENNTAKTGVGTAEIWVKQATRYAGMIFTVLTEGYRNGYADIWKFTNESGIAAIPTTGVTKQLDSSILDISGHLRRINYTSAIDANDVTKTAWADIKASNNTNIPTTGHGLLLNEADTGTKFQLWFPDNANTIYRRMYDNTNSVWGSWVQLKLTDTTYSAGTGLSLSGTTLNHSNSITAVTTAAFKKIKYDAQGHITGTADVAKADIPALDYLSKSGGDVTGSINLKSSTIDGSLENNGVTAKTYPTTFSVFDKSSRILVRTEAVIDNNGSLGWYSYIRNYKTDGTQVAQKGIKFTMNKTGALTWVVDDSANFRSAISAAASSHNHSASDINSGTLSADRLATSGATAGSYGPSANTSPAHSGTFSVPYITVDAKGRVTAISTKTITLPASGNTDSNVSQSATTTGNYRNVVLGYNNTSSASDNRTGTVTNVVYSSNKIFARPSEGRLYGEHLYAWVNSTDDVTVNLLRSGNSSWRFRNSSGNLFLENNFYSSKTQDWFPLIQFDYNATGEFSIETPPTATSTNRKISLAYNGITFKGCSLNGWAMGNKWINSANSVLIVNGVYGTSAGVMNYMFWGDSYNATTNAMRYYQSDTGLVTSCANGFRVVHGGYGAFFRNDSDNFYLLLTDKKTDGSEWYANWNNLRPIRVSLSTGLVTIGNGLWVNGTLTGTLSGNASTATLLQWANKPSTGTIEASTWRNGVTDGEVVWGQRWKDTALTTDTGDLTIWIKKDGTATTANMTIDGTITAVKGFIGKASSAGTADRATNSDNCKTTVTNPSTSTTYGIVFVADPTTTEDNTLRKSNDFRINHFRGAANTEGMTGLVLGNSTAKTAANNSTGQISLYNENGKFTTFKPGTNSTGNITIRLPDTAGTMTNVIYKTAKTATSVTNTGWTGNTADDNIVPTMSFMAYWNGRYSSSNSNLQYCDRGRFGTIVTKATGDYLAITGGTLTGSLTVNGLVPTTLASDADVNTVADGFWMSGTDGAAQSISNSPSTYGWAGLSTTLYSSGSDVRKTQIAWDRKGNMYIRGVPSADGVFSSWKSVSLSGHTHSYLPLSGGTLTGDVTGTKFIGALTGNASTATKLATARTLNTISFDGSANKIIPVQFCYHYDDSSDATTVSWHKVASTSTTSTNADKQITFYVVNNYSDTRTGGILKAYVRSGSTAGSYNKANLIWELKSSDAGMALANFVLVYTTNTTDGVFSAELWCKIAKRYESLKFVVLSMSDRTGKGNPNDAWTLYNTTDGVSAYTSGTKAITSTLGLSTVPNTISRAVYDTDGSDWTNTIGIGWATLPLTADEAGELACFTTSRSTVQGSPTHHIKNLQFSELKKKIEVVSTILFSGGTTSSTANLGYSVTDYQRLKIYATVNAMEVVVEIPALVGITRTIHAATPSPASQTNNIFYGVCWTVADKSVSCAGGKTSTLTSSASLSSSGVATVIKKVVGYKY